MTSTITIPRVWLETIATLSRQVERDLEKYVLDVDKLPPTSIHKLIGYSSSAETLLKYLK